MAETQTAEQKPVTQQPNKGGRPRKDGLPPGTEQNPGTYLKPLEFFAYTSAIPTKDWELYEGIYLYRLKPITDRQAGNNQCNYITKYGGPLDEDRVMRDHGSGFYRLQVIRTGSPNIEVARTEIEIMNPDYPPKIPPGEWVDDSRNRDWQWCRPKLGPHAINQPQNTATEIVDAALRLKMATEPVKQPDQSPQILAAIAPLLDPQRQTDSLLAIANLLKPPAPPEPKEDKTLALLLTMLIEDRKTMAAEMAELRKSMMTPQKHPLEFLIEHEELGRRLFGRGAGGASSEGKTWVDIVEKGIDKLAPGINTLAQAGAAFAMRGTQPTPVQPNPARTITVQPQPTQPMPGAPPSNAPVPAQPSESTSQETQEMNLGQLIQKYGPLLNQVTPFLMDQYAAGGEFGGYEFRDWFLSRHGQLTYSAVAHDLGVEGLLQIAKMNPQLWESLQPEQRFRAFFTDFFTEPGKERYGYADEPDENENDLEPDEPENEFEVRP